MKFGQLGRMDRLAASLTLLRGYSAQLWLFVQDLSQFKAVYPPWQSFQNVSQSSSTWTKPGSSSSGTGEHLQGRSLLTPDEVIRLGPTRPIVLVSGEPPYLLHRVSYLTDPAYAGRFDVNSLHLPYAAE